MLRNTLDNGRIISHTLLFLLIITLIGIYLYRVRRRNWLIVISAGTLAHLVFDEMWRTPETLFWPLFGFAFQRLEDLTYWLQ
ncbi:metal-dependent hydrolase, partial [Chloroflexota bacterium]